MEPTEFNPRRRDGDGAAATPIAWFATAVPRSLVLSMAWCVAAAGDWPRFLNRSIDGIADPPVQAIDWATTPAVVWSIPLGEGYGVGVVSDGNYLQFDAVADDQTGQMSERLRCFDAADGRPRWSHSKPLSYQDLYGYETGPRSSPTVAGDRVITLGVGGDLTCRDLADGQEIWSVPTNDRYHVVQNFFGVGSSPLVLQDRVIAMVGGSPPSDLAVPPGRLDRVTPDGSGLVAWDVRTGQELWRSVDDLASYSSPRPIRIGDRSCVLIYARDHLWCVDAASGDVLWKFGHRAALLESVNAMTPVVSGDHVFISECYELGSVLLRIDPGDDGKPPTPAVVWTDASNNRRVQAMRSHWATPVRVGQSLYGCSGRNSPDADLRCIDWLTGRVNWVVPTRRRSSLSAVGDVLLVLDERGTLTVMRADPQAAQVIATHDLTVGLQTADGRDATLAYPCWSAAVVTGDRVIVRGDRCVTCLRFKPL